MHTRQIERGSGLDSSLATLAELIVAGFSVAFVITGLPAALGLSMLASALAGLVLRSWQVVVILPAVSALVLWSLLIPAAASGEALSGLLSWAILATLITCPVPAAGAAVGATAGRYALGASSSQA